MTKPSVRLAFTGIAQQDEAVSGPKPFKFKRLATALGAEISGLDLALPMNDETFAAVHRAFLQSNGLLVFRDQNLTPEQHIAFSRRFGPLMVHVLRQFLLPGHPEILQVSNIVENGKPIGLGDAGRIWHSDLSYMPEPSLGSLLYAIELPEEGGDTSFANLSAAYDELPAEIKQQIDGKTAVHSYSHSYAQFSGSKFRPPLTEKQKNEVAEVVHPVVRRHPETGRKTLFVNEGFTSRIVDLPTAQSRKLLKFLFAHSTQPGFVYRHHWQERDLVLWDNRCTIHLAHGCPPQFRRHLHRTTVRGDAPC
jgi:taurine dioxygenase